MRGMILGALCAFLCASCQTPPAGEAGGPGVPVAIAAAILRATADDLATFDVSPADGFLTAAEAWPVGTAVALRILAAIQAAGALKSGGAARR